MESDLYYGMYYIVMFLSISNLCDLESTVKQWLYNGGWWGPFSFRDI